MIFEVHHAKNPTFGFGPTPSFPEEYDHVATVEAEHLGDTFRITNHIDHDWTTNPEVRWTWDGNCRSTSVGDVVVDADGKRFYCDNVGWKELTR